MVINVGNLEKGMQSEIKFTQTFALCDKSADVCFDGTISNVNGKYVLNASIEALYDLVCDRCIERFKKKLSFELNEVYVRGSADEEKDEISFEGSSIDTDDAVSLALIVNMPMKAVCKDECKGLCQKCGHNLNISECGCAKAYVNPYFENL